MKVEGFEVLSLHGVDASIRCVSIEFKQEMNNYTRRAKLEAGWTVAEHSTVQSVGPRTECSISTGVGMVLAQFINKKQRISESQSSSVSFELKNCTYVVHNLLASKLSCVGSE